MGDVKTNNNQFDIILQDDCELPYVTEEISDNIRIKAFHYNYYGILMSLAILDNLIKRYNKDYLNEKLKGLFHNYSIDRSAIKNIDMLRDALIYSKETYFNECDNYVNGRKCGSLLHLIIIASNPFRFVNVIKNCLNIDYYFNLFIYVNSHMSKLSIDTLVDYILSNCDRDLSLSIILDGVNLQSNNLKTIRYNKGIK